jgi:hypothetical protein
MKRNVVLSIVGLLLTTLMAFGKEEPKSIPFDKTGPFKHVDGSGPYRKSAELLRHQRNMARLAASGQYVADAVSVDVGDVAVIVDNGTILIPPQLANPFDLTLPTNITFTPGVDQFGVAFAAGVLDPGIGGDLGLGDDATTEVTFPAGFPFLGTTYTSIWVNSDGNITLGTGDSASSARDAARHIGGPPRVSPLFVDLDVTSGGSITADVRTDRVVVTWTNVPQFGIPDANTFQVVLDDSGGIEFAYGNIQASVGVVGVAEGGDQGPFNEIDLTVDLPGTFQAGAIFEEYVPSIPIQQMDVIQLAKEFYKTHADKYDFLVMFADPVVLLDPEGAAFAFHLGIQNQTLGLGLRGTSDSTDAIGPNIDELESILNMNRIGLYWPDAKKLENPPIKKFRFTSQVPGATLDGPPGRTQRSRRARRMGTLNGDFGAFGSYTLGLNSAMSIMGQEAGHRWLAFPAFVHPTKGLNFPALPEAFDLLGRANAHWSFFFNVTVPSGQFGGDPRASSEEGNAIVELGPGFAGFCTGPGQSVFLNQPNELIDGFTELDQYFMGLRTAGEVSPFWYVDEPQTLGGSNFQFFAGQPAQDDVAYCGKRVDLTVADITAVDGALPFPFPSNGVRTPAVGDEVDEDASGNPQLDVKTMAFILLVEQGPPNSAAHAATINQVDIFRSTWQQYGNGPATGGRGRFDTSLNPVIH